MITESMSWDEVSDELYKEFVGMFSLRQALDLYRRWDKANMKRTVFPVVYSYDFVSKRKNNCHFLVVARDRKALRGGRMGACFFIDMQTDHGTYLVSSCEKPDKAVKNNIIVVAPHALNRYEQRTESSKRGIELRKEFILSVVNTGAINEEDDDTISTAFGEGVLLGKRIGDNVFLFKTFIDDVTARGKIKSMKRSSLDYDKKMEILSSILRGIAEELCPNDYQINTDPFKIKKI